MESITAHARILDLFADRDAVVPDRWIHDLTDGSLSYRFEGSPNTFTWPADAVASIATKPAETPSARARSLLATWDAIERMLDTDDLRHPDLVEVDCREVSLIWTAEKLVVVVEREASEHDAAAAEA